MQSTLTPEPNFVDMDVAGWLATRMTGLQALCVVIMGTLPDADDVDHDTTQKTDGDTCAA
jgi:hypothetical protein